MKSIKCLILLVFSVTLVNKVSGQTLANFNFLEHTYLFHNPAKVALNSTEIVYINRRKTNTTVSSPMFSKSYLSVSQQLKNIKGLFHLNYFFDQYSFFNQNIISIGYSYPLEISKNHSLSIGIRFNGIINTIQYDQIKNINFETLQETKFHPDIDLGVYYTWKNLNIGIALKNISSPALKVNKISYIEIQLQLTTFYSINNC
ncbi:type IX secretion system membrane protein PorP/SprF [Aquimarina macrocephali]|uniref:type IX secretion system membrane protein PorP/SprF n=1 Tax=Aquimarina macrocephali TaxID=666563 RepID=UPI0004632E1F|nr:type IX secretion system membrane protein PorP/SprF [Aquimarina macrocephali]